MTSVVLTDAGPSYGSQGLDPGCQTWQQVPFLLSQRFRVKIHCYVFFWMTDNSCIIFSITQGQLTSNLLSTRKVILLQRVA